MTSSTAITDNAWCLERAKEILQKENICNRLSTLISHRLDLQKLRIWIREEALEDTYKLGGWSGRRSSLMVLSILKTYYGDLVSWDYLHLSRATTYGITKTDIEDLVIESQTNISPQQVKEELKMSTKFFEQQALLNGQPLASLDKGAIFVAIDAQDTRIKNLESIQTKPQVLKDEITAAKAELVALVAYLDAA